MTTLALLGSAVFTLMILTTNLMTLPAIATPSGGIACPLALDNSGKVRTTKARKTYFDQAFEHKYSTDSLSSRLNVFMQKWPSRIKMVSGVKIRVSEPGSTRRALSGERNVLFISTSGLSAERLEKMKRDFLGFITDRTVSFPLSSGGGHLYTRVGNQAIDWLGGNPTVQEYSMANNSSRLETVVELTRPEFNRLRHYLKNVQTDSDQTLGSFNYDGTQVTKGTIKDNTATTSGCGHNCTSWMATAPIGSDGTRLLQLLGVTTRKLIGDNPGWWTGFIATEAAPKKVPFVIYWSAQESVNDLIESAVTPEKNLVWDFGAHG